MRIGVIGAGSWGTTLANSLARAGHDVAIWAYEREVVQTINETHANPLFLPDCPLATPLRAFADLAQVVQARELLVLVTPSHVVRAMAGQLAHALADVGEPVLVSASKGLEEDTHLVMTEVIGQALPRARTVALSGPTFAREVYDGQPTAVVAASADPAAAALAQETLSTGTFRVYTSQDVLGVQLGGALKNVIAIASGMLDGLGMGHNPRAALLTRGLAEMTRLGEALGASPHTFAGLAGMGDLILTATGALSRNRSLGIELGRGRALDDVLRERRTVTEGVHTARAALALGQATGVELPIVEEIAGILFEGRAPDGAIRNLMARELKPERWR